MRFWIDRRLAVLGLMDCAWGTAHAHYGEQFVDSLISLALEQLLDAFLGMWVSVLNLQCANSR